MSDLKIGQLNNELYAGKVQKNDETASLMTSSNLNRVEGKSYSTSNAGTEELKPNDNVTMDYICAAIDKLCKGKNLKYKDEKGIVKSLSLAVILEKLGENKKFDMNKLLNMKKEQFDNILKCINAAIEDSVDSNGFIDTKKAFRYFTAYSLMVLKAGDSKLSVEEQIAQARKELKEQEGKSVQDKLGGIDINNEEELVNALKEYLNIDDLQKRLSEAKSDEEKKEIIKGEIREIVKLLHGSSKEEMMKVGFALLKAVQGTGLVMVLDSIADMLIPDGMREKFIKIVSENKDLLIKVGGFTEDEIRELSAYLAKNGTFEENQQSLDALNASLQKLQPVFNKIEEMRQAYIAEQVKNGRNENEITREEFYEYLRNQQLATEEEIDGHNLYIQQQAELEGMTAGFIGSENLTQDQTQQLIRQAQEIAKNFGFEEEFLQGVNQYIQEHGEDYNIPQEKINEILNNATEGRYSEVTGAGVETSETTVSENGGFGITSENTTSQTETVEQAINNAQNIRERINEQTNTSDKEQTTVPVVAEPRTEFSLGILPTLSTTVEAAKQKTVQHYSTVAAAVKDNSQAKFSEIKKMTGEATGALVEFCFTTQNISTGLLQGAKARFDACLTCVRENIGNSGNLTTEAVSLMKQDSSSRKFLNEKYLSKDERQEMGV